jgi:type III secretion protein S
MLTPFELGLREALRLLSALALPILGALLVAGLLAAVLQAVTRVRDRSISVVPRLVAVGVALVLVGGWCGSRLVAFSAQMFQAAEVAGRPPAGP